MNNNNDLEERTEAKILENNSNKGLRQRCSRWYRDRIAWKFYVIFLRALDSTRNKKSMNFQIVHNFSFFFLIWAVYVTGIIWAMTTYVANHIDSDPTGKAI